jgi:hypothetical protein
MSLGSTRKTAERRVRGIFMRKRSSYKARIAAAVLAAVMLVACFTTACQPAQGETVTASGENSTPSATPEYSAPSEPHETESSAAQTIAPTASATESPTSIPTIAETPSPEPAATLPPGISREARFAADTDGDGNDETVVVGKAKGSEAICVYVLYAGGYDRIVAEEGSFKCAFMTHTGGGNLCLLVSIDLASEDYITYSFSFNRRKPVLKDEANGYVYGIDGTRVTLGGHLYVIGTWDYTCEFDLKNNFTLEQVSDYTIMENWMEPLHTIRELPVERLAGGAYVAGTLPAGTLVTPVSTDGSSYLRFRLEDGSAGRILFTRGEHVEAYIAGIIESEYFDNIEYSD